MLAPVRCQVPHPACEDQSPSRHFAPCSLCCWQTHVACRPLLSRLCLLQWAGSCWYYLRYIDPGNDAALVDPEAEKYWMPVDLYVGGAEHAVLHLLYARFWHKVSQADALTNALLVLMKRSFLAAACAWQRCGCGSSEASKRCASCGVQHPKHGLSRPGAVVAAVVVVTLEGNSRGILVCLCGCNPRCCTTLGRCRPRSHSSGWSARA